VPSTLEMSRSSNFAAYQTIEATMAVFFSRRPITKFEPLNTFPLG
jgi:hypothetical protein